MSVSTWMQWMLGFVEEPERSTDLLRHRFPSKVGGRPVSVTARTKYRTLLLSHVTYDQLSVTSTLLSTPSAYLHAGMAQPSTAAHTGPAQVQGDRQAAAVPDASVRANR